MKDIFEIALRIKGGSDYCIFEIDGDTDLHELEILLYDMICSHFAVEEGSEE